MKLSVRTKTTAWTMEPATYLGRSAESSAGDVDDLLNISWMRYILQCQFV